MNEKIMVVDDDKDIREVIQVLLSSEGYTVVEASNGKEALELVDDDTDLIILDVMMPEMNGYQACVLLREKTKAPILFLTAKGQDGKKLNLTDLEYNILEYLLMNKQQVISPSQLFEAIWHEEYYYGANNTIMVHIRHLRQKIEKDPTNPEHIKTIWGKGYYCE